ncbi:MAG: hypothetical protein AB7N71_12515, partial [Phycisphaerae bacterium]
MAAILLCATPLLSTAGEISGFLISPFTSEQQLDLRVAQQIRVLINAPSAASFDATRPTRFIFYALPNGNTIEQTLGCAPQDELHWRHYIQHIGAQTRRFREVSQDENVILLLLETDQKSWPAWRAAHADHAARIRRLVDDLTRLIPHNPATRTITLTGHSGGGSFLTGYLNSVEEMPRDVTCIAYL